MIDCDLSPDEISRIIRFLGYGSLSAPLWFIGMEEGLGGMSEADCCVNLRARATFERTMDLREAHLRLRQGGIPIDIEGNTPATQVWRFMAKIALSGPGNVDWSDPKIARDYVRYELGRERKGKTFLTELSPIPSKKAAGQEWMQFFSERDPDIESKLSRRKDDLKHELAIRNPSVVICYGLKRADDFAELLDVEWKPISRKVHTSSDHRRFLLPFFGQGQMSKSLIEELRHAHPQG